MPTVAIDMNATSIGVPRHTAAIVPAVKPTVTANSVARMPSDAEIGKPSAMTSFTE